MISFEELGVSAPILKAIEELGFENPMPVQEKVIPYLLEGNGDVVALAQTGTGKTAAFGIPIIQMTDIDSSDAQFLVLSPTRELCVQIASDLADFSHYIQGLHVIPMYGGSSIENQIRNFKRGAHIIVATPGRLIDLMERGVVHLDTIRAVILDEADEMLDMGFSEALEKILSSVPIERKMLMFSATMSKEISAIAKKYLYNPQEIVIGSRNEGAENVNHVYYMVHAKDKYLALKRIVDYYPHIYAIIFCRTRLETQEVADKLMQDGYNADSLHGELSQAQRDLTMNKFRKRQLQLLVATDVAARGLDVDNLTHVINYGLPDDTENYTHRSGRTGRAGKKGTSIAIINLREKGKIRFIEKAIGKKFNIGEMPSGRQICEKQLYKVIDEIERTQVDEEQIEKFLPDIFRRLDWMDKEDIIKRIVTMEFGRFMRYYKDAPELEAVNIKAAEKAEKEEKKKKERQPKAGYTRFFINLGKLDNIMAVHIIDHINKHIKERIDLGRIDIKHSFSFFEAPAESTNVILSALNNTHLRNREIRVEVAEASTANGTTQKDSGKKEKRKDSKRGSQQEKSQKELKNSSKKQRATRAPQNQFGDFIDEFEDFDFTTAKPKKSSRSKKQSDHWQKEFNQNDWKQFFGEPERKSRRGAGRNGNQNSRKRKSRR